MSDMEVENMFKDEISKFAFANVLDIGFNTNYLNKILEVSPDCKITSLLKTSAVNDSKLDNIAFIYGDPLESLKRTENENFYDLILISSAYVNEINENYYKYFKHNSLILFEGFIAQNSFKTVFSNAVICKWNRLLAASNVDEICQYETKFSGFILGFFLKATSAAQEPVKQVIFYGTHPSINTGYAKIARFITNSLAKTSKYSVWHVSFDAQEIKVDRKYVEPVDKRVKIISASLASEDFENDRFGTKLIFDLNELIEPDCIILYNDEMVLYNALSRLSYRSPKTKIITYMDKLFHTGCDYFIPFCLSKSDEIVMFSEHWRKWIIEKYKIPESKVHVFNHTHDEKLTSLPLRGSYEDLNLASDLRELYFKSRDEKFVVFNSNRNCSRKRLDITILAFFEFLKNANYPENAFLFLNCNEKGSYVLPDVSFRLANYVTKYSPDLTNKLVSNVIIFNGHLPESHKEQLLVLSSVCVNTCDGEGFGLCQLEGLCAGVKQITSHVGGLIDMYENVKDTGAFVTIKPCAIYEQDDHLFSMHEVSNYKDFANALTDAYNFWKSHPRHEYIGLKEKILDTYNSVKLFENFEKLIYTDFERTNSVYIVADFVEPNYDSIVNMMSNIYKRGCKFAVLINRTVFTEETMPTKFSFIKALEEVENSKCDTFLFKEDKSFIITRKGLNKFVNYIYDENFKPINSCTLFEELLIRSKMSIHQSDLSVLNLVE